MTINPYWANAAYPPKSYIYPTTAYIGHSEVERLRFALELIGELDDIAAIKKLAAKALKAK